MIALRITNTADRAKVSAALPDELGGLADLLPSLRTGEGLFLGEAMAIPSRVRIRKALKKPVGDDPKLPEAWQNAKAPWAELYTQALVNWRAQSIPAAGQDLSGDKQEEEVTCLT
jgi:DNA helicase HerA-like ATPase